MKSHAVSNTVHFPGNQETMAKPKRYPIYGTSLEMCA